MACFKTPTNSSQNLALRHAAECSGMLLPLPPPPPPPPGENFWSPKGSMAPAPVLDNGPLFEVRGERKMCKFALERLLDDGQAPETEL